VSLTLQHKRRARRLLTLGPHPCVPVQRRRVERE
jgi:hypothetical protein